MAQLSLHGALIELSADRDRAPNVTIELDNGHVVRVGRLSEDQVRELKPLLFEHVSITIEAAE